MATPKTLQTLVAAGVLATVALLAFGAIGIPSDAGYAGVGPNFLPWVVACGLLLCGGFLLWEAQAGGSSSLHLQHGTGQAEAFLRATSRHSHNNSNHTSRTGSG